jgi:hypothetical protein
MPMAYNAKKKFNWRKGDVKADLPQCHDCERNLGPDECEIYGEKPEDIVLNKRIYPYKVKEGE